MKRPNLPLGLPSQATATSGAFLALFALVAAVQAIVAGVGTFPFGSVVSSRTGPRPEEDRAFDLGLACLLGLSCACAVSAALALGLVAVQVIAHRGLVRSHGRALSLNLDL